MLVKQRERFGFVATLNANFYLGPTVTLFPKQGDDYASVLRDGRLSKR